MKPFGQFTLSNLSVNDRKFLEWCLKHEKELSVFMAIDLFKTKGAKIILNFTPSGALNEVVRAEQRIWRREKT